MSSPSDESEDGDWSAALTALQRLHARLSTTADAVRVVLARPAARGDGDVTGLGWGLEGLPEAERVALYASVCEDLQRLGGLTEPLEQLSDMLEARGPTSPPR
jgi:hypothetical protein